MITREESYPAQELHPKGPISEVQEIVFVICSCNALPKFTYISNKLYLSAALSPRHADIQMDIRLL